MDEFAIAFKQKYHFNRILGGIMMSGYSPGFFSTFEGIKKRNYV
jgi:hypothetical protein